MSQASTTHRIMAKDRRTKASGRLHIGARRLARHAVSKDASPLRDHRSNMVIAIHADRISFPPVSNLIPSLQAAFRVHSERVLSLAVTNSEVLCSL